ncbi:transcriptional regulator [Nocardiopsis kunsanensis]|uniref:Transcriptional regulator n=1 Tax=Nocardiopsis kunsanensis TaxID=141693 RepID=A0A918XHD3_9ACTN|nr:helix-turn-helix transcriptional regulator [Nocardiopsis kunsanensis]GHD32409.1 transcriptional regulator [Nocardiopsis kunsanensis]
MSTRARSNPHSPTVRLRRLAAEMHRARLRAGYSQLSDAAKALGWSGPKLSRIEDAKTRHIKPGDIDRLCDLYEIKDVESRDALHALARQARERGWWSEYRDVFGDNVLPDFEVEATMIRNYQGLVLPGLLQTAEYTEQVFRGGQAHPEDIVERHVAARLERQQILNRQRPPHFTAVIDEAALRRRVGAPGVMRDQLQHLLNMATRHNVDIQVLPFDAGPHAATTGSFVIMDFENEADPSIAYTETATGHLIAEGEGVVPYVSIFGHVQAAALRASETVSFISALLAQESNDPS